MCHTQAYDGVQDSGAPALVESFLHSGLCARLPASFTAYLPITRKGKEGVQRPQEARQMPPNGVYRLDTEAECRRIREGRQGLRFAAQVILTWASADPRIKVDLVESEHFPGHPSGVT